MQWARPPCWGSPRFPYLARVALDLEVSNKPERVLFLPEPRCLPHWWLCNPHWVATSRSWYSFLQSSSRVCTNAVVVSCTFLGGKSALLTIPLQCPMYFDRCSFKKNCLFGLGLLVLVFEFFFFFSFMTMGFYAYCWETDLPSLGIKRTSPGHHWILLFPLIHYRVPQISFSVTVAHLELLLLLL